MESVTSQRRTVTVTEAARQLGISRSFAYQAIARGDFPVPVIRIGGRVVVSRTALDRYLDGEIGRVSGGDAA